MIIFLIICLIVCVLFLGVTRYLSKRNNQVYEFRRKVLNLILSVDVDKSHFHRLDRIYELQTYNKMMMSFKPLTLGIWYPEIQKIISDKMVDEVEAEI